MNAPKGTIHENNRGDDRIRRRGRLTFYHPNGRGNGTALRLELRLNRKPDDRYDCFFLEMARQKPVEPDGRKSPAAFDWEGRVTAKLDVEDVSAILLVLEGRRDHAGGSNGIYHESGLASTLIEFRRHAERDGYFAGLSRKTKAGDSVFKGALLLSEAEAVALRCVLQTGLFYMVFHENLSS